MAGTIKGITIEIDGNTQKLTDSFKDAEKSAKGLQKELRGVETLLKMDPSNVTLLKQKQDILNQSISATKEKLKELENAQKQVQEQFNKGEITEEQYRDFQREIEETRLKLKALEEQARSFGSVMSQQLKASGEKMIETGEKISDAGEKFLPVTAAVTAVGTASVAMAADFEASMSQVQATMGITKDATSELNGETVNTMDALEALAAQMGEKTAFSAKECADALNYLALAGYDTQEIYDTLPTVLNLAAAGGMDLASASDMVTDAMSALGLGTKDATTMVDQMATTASSSNTSVAQLGEALLTLGGTGKIVAGGTNELNTALGILADNGMKGSEGGTILRNVILSLTAPTDKAAAVMESLGVSAFDADGNMRPLNDTLADLDSAMATMTTAEKQEIISTIFNKNDLKGVNALLANCGDRWDELSLAIDNSAGSAQQMADTQLDNLKGQLTLLKSSLEGLAITIGNIILPVIKSIVSAIQGVVTWLNSMDESTARIIVVIAGLAAAIGPVLITIGKATALFGHLLVGAGQVSGFISSVLIPAITAISAPVWAVIAVVGSLVAAFVSLWTSNEEFRNRIIEIWNVIVGKVSEFIQGILDRINALGFDFGSVLEALQAAWDAFCTYVAPVFITVWELISEVFSAVLDALMGVLDIFIGLFTGNWEQMWTGVQELFSGVWDAIVALFTAALDLLCEILGPILNWISSAWKTTWTNIKTFFSSTWQALSNTVSTVLETIRTFIQTKLDAIKQKFSDIWENIKSSVTSKIDGIKTAISNGIESAKSTVTDKLNAIRDKFTSIWDGCKSVVSAAIEKIKSIMNFSWSLPKLKLPHISISGSFSLMPPSVPSFSISWYKKAMENGIIMDIPTIFGFDPSSMTFHAGGEAGPEAVVGTQSLQDMIYQAVGRGMTCIQSSGINYDLLASKIADAVASRPGVVQIDGKRAGKVLTPYIDKNLAEVR